MKDKIRSLLGIEMSIGDYQVKPILLLLGILLFISLSIPLLVAYFYLVIKNSLYISWNEIKKGYKYNKYKGLKRV